MAIPALVSWGLLAPSVKTILMTVGPTDASMERALMESTVIHAVAIQASLVNCVIRT